MRCEEINCPQTSDPLETPPPPLRKHKHLVHLCQFLEYNLSYIY